MRWNPKPTKTPGVDKRTVRRFALWPTFVECDCGAGAMVWLEFYDAYQEWTDMGYGGLGWRTLTRLVR